MGRSFQASNPGSRTRGVGSQQTARAVKQTTASQGCVRGPSASACPWRGAWRELGPAGMYTGSRVGPAAQQGARTLDAALKHSARVPSAQYQSLLRRHRFHASSPVASAGEPAAATGRGGRPREVLGALVGDTTSWGGSRDGFDMPMLSRAATPIAGEGVSPPRRPSVGVRATGQYTRRPETPRPEQCAQVATTWSSLEISIQSWAVHAIRHVARQVRSMGLPPAGGRPAHVLRPAALCT
jgi:hypothetical protein